jgi:uncharacterized membrane protein YdcZ (DUF606 family)
MNEFLLYGLIGGAIPDLLRIINNRYQLSLPGYLKSINFYVGFIFLLILGMVTVQLLQAGSITEALSYGYSAPQVISGLLGNMSKTQKTGKENRSMPESSRMPEKFSILDFWKW